MNMQSLETGAQPEQGRTWVMSAVPQAAWLVAACAAGMARRAGWLAVQAGPKAAVNVTLKVSLDLSLSLGGARPSLTSGAVVAAAAAAAAASLIV